ncbi:hypothetical protein I6F66_21520, partial [Pseudoalteromonas sp. NZS100_1]|nr:hypothetical protein [Pseudoalteromonas sp. NZS100_1]
EQGIARAEWPARMQRLTSGRLVDAAPKDAEVWLDGGHNPSAGDAIARALPQLAEGRLAVVLGMLANKDMDAYLAPFGGRIAHIHALPVPGHDHHPPERFAAVAARWGIGCTAHDDPQAAIAAIAQDAAQAQDAAPIILIAGSLYMAGEILRLNGQLPD